MKDFETLAGNYFQNRQLMAEHIANERGCDPSDIRWFNIRATAGTRKEPHPEVEELASVIPIEGWGNVYTDDRFGTAFDPEGFDLRGWESNPIGFFNHNPNLPAVIYDPSKSGVQERDGQSGLYVEGSVLGDTDDQKKVQTFTLQRAVRALSIGFLGGKVSTRKVNGRKVQVFGHTDVTEVSLVTVPGNRESLFDIARSVTEGDDLVCSKCLSKPASLTRVANFETALKSAEAYAEDMMRRGDVEHVGRMLETILTCFDSLAGGCEHRVGAVLSRKNKSKLKKALELINELLSAAEKDDKSADSQNEEKKEGERQVDSVVLETLAEEVTKQCSELGLTESEIADVVMKAVTERDSGIE